MPDLASLRRKARRIVSRVEGLLDALLPRPSAPVPIPVRLGGSRGPHRDDRRS